MRDGEFLIFKRWSVMVGQFWEGIACPCSSHCEHALRFRLAFQLIHAPSSRRIAWHRLETRQARKPQPQLADAAAVTTKSPPSATEPRKRGGSTYARRAKAAADVRGARGAGILLFDQFDVPARRQRRGLLPALPVRFELHVRHGAPRAGARCPPLPCGATCSVFTGDRGSSRPGAPLRASLAAVRHQIRENGQGKRELLEVS